MTGVAYAVFIAFFYFVLACMLGFLAVVIQMCVDAAKTLRRNKQGEQRLERRILEDEQVAQLDALYELPSRTGRVA